MKHLTTMTFLLLAAGPIFSNSPSFGQQSTPVTLLVSHGVVFAIPPGYMEHKSKDGNTVIFEPHEDSRTFALIKVYFEHRLTAIPGHDLTQEKMEQLHLSKTTESKAILAGREGKCAEYSVKAKSGIVLAQAECSFSTELHTSFFGDPKNLSIFYAFMQAAEPARKDRQL